MTNGEQRFEFRDSTLQGAMAFGSEVEVSGNIVQHGGGSAAELRAGLRTALAELKESVESGTDNLTERGTASMELGHAIRALGRAEAAGDDGAKTRFERARKILDALQIGANVSQIASLFAQLLTLH